MKLAVQHKWDLSSEKAVALQKELAPKVINTSQFGRIRYIGGAGVHVRDDIGRAAIVVLDFNTLKPLDLATAMCPVTFPYKPNLVGFREGPVLLEALARLDVMPDMLIVDGHGIAHPRKFGFASHIGVLTDLPTIGCSKGCFEEPQQVDGVRGSYTLVYNGDEVIGAAVCTQQDMPPLYVSIGHRVDLETSIKYVLATSRQQHYLPETLHLAKRTVQILGKVPKLLQNGFTT
jgi:deoxyribonuclease V